MNANWRDGCLNGICCSISKIRLRRSAVEQTPPSGLGTPVSIKPDLMYSIVAISASRKSWFNKSFLEKQSYMAIPLTPNANPPNPACDHLSELRLRRWSWCLHTVSRCRSWQRNHRCCIAPTLRTVAATREKPRQCRHHQRNNRNPDRPF